jgi:hypothetical protein
MKYISLIMIGAFLVTTPMFALANLISNGNFSTCDYASWSKDTDGFGDASIGNDFEIKDDAGDCSSNINVDYFSTQGDSFSTPISEAFFANTLFQELDFTANTDSTFKLSMDISGFSELTSAAQSFIADYFLIGLNDGTGNYFNESGDLGFLVSPADIDGMFSGSLIFELGNSFANKTGWFLDFQVILGFDSVTFLTDGYGSTLEIDNVSLIEVKAPATEVPAPSILSLLLIFASIGLGMKLGLVTKLIKVLKLDFKI